LLGKAPLIYEAGQWEIDTVRRELRARGTPVPVGARTFEIIEALVKSAGQLVTKDELMKQVWPGAIIGENTLQVHIWAIRKALGADRAMLKTISRRGYRLLGNWHTRAYDSLEPVVDKQSLLARAPPATNFPISTTDLIGRSQALTLLRALATAYRLVTLTGPGGIGKSVLAIELGRSLLAEFQDGGWLVELAPLSGPGLVPSATAEVIGLRLSGSAISPEAVANAIGRNKLLLIVDNCEHLVDAAAQLVQAVVRQCPNALVIATSREALRLDGEYIYRVPPLDIPASNQETATRLLERSSVELFVARTKALHPDFSPDQATLPAVADICRHLDGIPLAIEFAAARAATLGVRQVLSGLRDRFALLTTGRRTALPRHRTLRATLDWSYELLSEAERMLLRHLAVFPGGFTLEAAAAVVGATGLDTSTVTDGIANLVEKSLVARDRSETAGRWHLLETIRAYALDKLAGHNELAAAMRRQATYFRNLFDLSVNLSQEDLALRILEMENVRSAIDWCYSGNGAKDVGVALTTAYVPVWLRQSQAAECIMRCERALETLDLDEAARAAVGKPPAEYIPSSANTAARYRMQLLAGYALAILLTRGTSPETIGAWARVLKIAESLGDTEFQLRALWGLFAEHFTQGSCEAALANAERFRAVGVLTDQADVFIGERMIGTALHHLGRQRDARRHIERFLENETALVDPRRSAVRFPFDPGVAARCYRSRTLWLQGYPDQAFRGIADAIRLSESLDQPASLFYALFQAACPIALLGADLPAADALARRLLDLSARHAMESWRIAGQCYMGMLLTKQNSDKTVGIEMIRAALSELPESAYQIHYVQILADMADALAHTGELEQALATIDAALSRCKRTAEGWYLPELMRVRGELLMQRAGGRTLDGAEDHFSRALEMAAQQGALAWELRAAISLARLRMQQGRAADARTVLASVYGRFTDGFASADLVAARALLDALPV